MSNSMIKQSMKLEILNTQNSNSGKPVHYNNLNLMVRETHMREDNRKPTMGPKSL